MHIRKKFRISHKASGSMALQRDLYNRISFKTSFYYKIHRTSFLTFNDMIRLIVYVSLCGIFNLQYL